MGRNLFLGVLENRRRWRQKFNKLQWGKICLGAFLEVGGVGSQIIKNSTGAKSVGRCNLQWPRHLHRCSPCLAQGLFRFASLTSFFFGILLFTFVSLPLSPIALLEITNSTVALFPTGTKPGETPSAPDLSDLCNVTPENSGQSPRPSGSRHSYH